MQSWPIWVRSCLPASLGTCPTAHASLPLYLSRHLSLLSLLSHLSHLSNPPNLNSLSTSQHPIYHPYHQYSIEYLLCTLSPLTYPLSPIPYIPMYLPTCLPACLPPLLPCLPCLPCLTSNLLPALDCYSHPASIARVDLQPLGPFGQG